MLAELCTSRTGTKDLILHTNLAGFCGSICSLKIEYSRVYRSLTRGMSIMYFKTPRSLLEDGYVDRYEYKITLASLHTKRGPTGLGRRSSENIQLLNTRSRGGGLSSVLSSNTSLNDGERVNS